MIAEMGKPKAVSTGRKKNPAVKKNGRGTNQSGRFLVETNSSSDGDKTGAPSSTTACGKL